MRFQRVRSILWSLAILVWGVLIFFVGLAMFARPAHAQLVMPDGKVNTACAELGTEPRSEPLPVPPAPRLAPGLPKQLGGRVCSEALVTADRFGAAVGWWCPKVTPEKAQLAIYAVTWESITLPMLIDFGLLLMPGVDNGEHVRQMQTKYQSRHILDMCNVWTALAPRLNAIMPAPLPVPAEWRTLGGTVFTYANGRLTGVTSKRVAPGVACDERSTATSGARVFKSIVGGPATEVAECLKQ